MTAQSPSYFARLGVLLGAGFILVLLQQGGMAGILRESILFSLKPGLAAARSVADLGKGIDGYWRYWQDGTHRLAAAQHELARLQVDQQLLADLTKENNLLRQELGRRRPEQPTFKFYGGGTVWFIDGGCRQGVTVGRPVLFEGGLVGVIKQVGANYSVVITITDRSWRLPVRVGEASVQGLLETSRGVAEVSQLSTRDELSVGDLVTTQGLEEVPPGLPIGTISHIESDSGTGSRRATIEPYFLPQQLDWVQVPIEEGDECES